MKELLDNVVDIAKQAGDVIMDIYNSNDFNVEIKDNDSPLTRANIAANDVIVAALENPPFLRLIKFSYIGIIFT